MLYIVAVECHHFRRSARDYDVLALSALGRMLCVKMFRICRRLADVVGTVGQTEDHVLAVGITGCDNIVFFVKYSVMCLECHAILRRVG